MAKISPRTLDRSIFDGVESPLKEALVRLLDRLDEQGRDLGTALNRGLTFGENMATSIVELVFVAPTIAALPTLPTWTHDAPRIAHTLSSVIGVLPLSCRADGVQTNESGGCPAIEWDTVSGNAIRIKSVSGLIAGRTYRMRLLLISG